MIISDRANNNIVKNQPQNINIVKNNYDNRENNYIKDVKDLESKKQKEEQENIEKYDKIKEKKIDINIPKNMIEQFNELVAKLGIEMRYVDIEETKQFRIDVVNRKNGKLIRTIPPEELLKANEKTKDLVGLIYNRVI